MIVSSSPSHQFIEPNHNFSPKCTGIESRLAAYKLLVNLTTSCISNMKTIVQLLISLHHQLNPEAVKEVEVS